MRQSYAAAAAVILVLGAGPVLAAQSVTEKVLFQDTHVRFVEVTVPPGVSRAGPVPTDSIVMFDAPWPQVREVLDGNQTADRSDAVTPKDGGGYPRCFAEGPLPARTITVSGARAQHYFRLDYGRIDGAAYGSHWRAWYRDVFGAAKHAAPNPGRSLAGGPPFSKTWPYDIRYSAINSAPGNHTIRFQDRRLELLEVAIRPGETENMHGHPYPSVYADDGGFQPKGAVYKNATLEPNVGPPWGATSRPPKGAVFPVCFAAVPEAPHQVSVIKGPPQHFYRVHFKTLVSGQAKGD